MDLTSLEIRLRRSENLPVLPQAVSSVIRLADDPNAGPKDLEKVIERDPAITAKVLRVANSAYYGGQNAATVGRAIAFLGTNAVRSLVVSIAFQQMISAKAVCPHFNKVEYWRHSLGVATACRILGKMRMPAKSEELYVAGMMHDIGMLIFERFMPTEFDTALEISQSKGYPLHITEREVCGFDHAELGSLLATNWGMSALVKNAVRYHHEPLMDGDYYETTCFVAAANSLAHQCGLTNNAVGVEYEIDPMVAEAIGLPTEQFVAIKDVMVHEVMRAQSAFHIS